MRILRVSEFWNFLRKWYSWCSRVSNKLLNLTFFSVLVVCSSNQPASYNGIRDDKNAPAYVLKKLFLLYSRLLERRARILAPQGSLIFFLDFENEPRTALKVAFFQKFVFLRCFSWKELCSFWQKSQL